MQVQVVQLPFRAVAISADGNVMVGFTGGSLPQPVSWTAAGGLVQLGLLPGSNFAWVVRTSRDGSVTVGISGTDAPPAWQPTVWLAATGAVGLGTLPGTTVGWASDVSLDGSVVVGYCRNAAGIYESFRWTAATGMVSIGGFPGQQGDVVATATNADGGVVVGYGTMNGRVHAFRWSGPTGMVPLGVAQGFDSSQALDVSADGNVIVGAMHSTVFSMREAFKWTPSGGLVGLGDLAGGPHQSWATTISPSGNIIFGTGRPSNYSTETVFWTALQGPIVLSEYLYQHGVFTGGPPVSSVSGDGLRLAGSTDTSGWLTTLAPVWSTYCSPKVNSQGCYPTISASGVPSASNVWTFEVITWEILNQKVGLYFYKVGGTAAATPFQGGTLCVGPAGVRRTPGQFTGGNPVPAQDCSGSLALDFNAFAVGLAGGNPDPLLLTLGYMYRCQAWSRDPGFAPPNNTSLSNALQVPIGP